MLDGELQNTFGTTINWGRWSERIDAKLPTADDSARVNTKGKLFIIKLDIRETGFNSSFSYKHYVELFICAALGV